MNHERQTCLYRPAHLFFEGFQLLLFKLPSPIEVETYLADRASPHPFRQEGEQRTDRLQLLAPVSAHFFGMQAYHRVDKAQIAVCKVNGGQRRLEVDGRDKNLFTACLLGTLYDGFQVVMELFAV